MTIQVNDSSFTDVTNADRLRGLLRRAGLSQRAAAKLLHVEERTLRQWCAGQGTPPAAVFRALSPRLTHAEHTRRRIKANEEQLAALRDGRIRDIGYGPTDAGPQSIKQEIRRLECRIAEDRALLHMDEALERRREAHEVVFSQWRPHGSGAPRLEDIDALDKAEAEVKTAQAEMDHITQKIRTGVWS